MAERAERDTTQYIMLYSLSLRTADVLDRYRSLKMKEAKYMFIIIVSALMLQGCSWMHMLQIKNTTNAAWQVEYEIVDERGIIKNQIYTQYKNEKNGQFKEYESKSIKFEIKPNQTVRIGMARNSHYKVYKKYTEFDKEIPWKTFINVDEIRIFNDNESFRIRAKQLDKVLSKNSRGIARIDINKVIELSKTVVP